jgi:two-component system nitrate/nitrite response regulator NarL
MQKTRVLLVDDHALFRGGLAALLFARPEFEIVGEAEDGLEAIEKARETKPDVILMDVYMPRCDGVTALRTIKKEMPDVKVVMLTVCEDDGKLIDAISCGAQGYLLKKLRPRELFSVLDGVLRGEAAVSPALATKLLAEYRKRESGEARTGQSQDELSEREREVLKLVAFGASNSEIAEALKVTETTVKFHLRNILSKLHLRNRVQAAVYAVEAGLFRSSKDAE